MMNSDENRECSSQNDCCNPSCPENENTRAEMLNEIKCLAFAIQELALYLDTHPDDACAVNMYNSFSKQLNEAIRNYECKYGPLTNFGYGKSGCPWQWVEQPWPWDREFNC